MKTFARISFYTLAFLVLPLVVGVIGFASSHRIVMSHASNPVAFVDKVSPPVLDPNKPTVAVLLGSDITQITDFLVPYNIFSVSQAFNVYAVAPQRRLTTLTGGLDVLPHLSLSGFDKWVGKNPDVIIVPYIPNVQSAENKLILDWIKRHATQQTLLLSICTGAENLAATGLLDGRTATTHWGAIGRLEVKYPKVNWVRGVRYVDEGNIVTSAGITSGIDATLHVLARLKGTAVTRNIASNLHYSDYHFVEAPEIQQYNFQLKDAIYLLNTGYRWSRRNSGVLLYDQVDEIDLASIFDVYAASSTTNTHTVTTLGQAITSKNGLYLVPRWDFQDASALDRLLIPGEEAIQRAKRSVEDWREKKQKGEIVYIHSGSARFAFDAPLEDLARQENVPTAEFAAKNLDYRASSVHLEGRGWPLLLILQPLFIGLLGLGLAFWLDKLLAHQKKRQHRSKRIV
jgi:AraC family transcriptional regulator, transcriptional activator FtrA